MNVAITIGDRTYALAFSKGTVAALLLAVSLISGTAWADYTVYGAGADSCGKWLAVKEINSPARQYYHSWISGYLTAYSSWVEDGSGPVSKIDAPGAWAWIDNYCQDNTLKYVAEAAEQLIYAIKAK